MQGSYLGGIAPPPESPPARVASMKGVTMSVRKSITLLTLTAVALTVVRAASGRRAANCASECTGGFRRGRSRRDLRGSRRWRLPGGTCTHWKAPPCHGAPIERSSRIATVDVASWGKVDRRQTFVRKSAFLSQSESRRRHGSLPIPRVAPSPSISTIFRSSIFHGLASSRARLGRARKPYAPGI